MIMKLNKEEQESYKHFESIMDKIMKCIDSSMNEILPELLKMIANKFTDINNINDEVAKKRLDMLVKDGFDLWCCKKGELLIERQKTISELSEAIENNEKN